MLVVGRIFGTLLTVIVFLSAFRWIWVTFLRRWLFKEELTAKVTEASLAHTGEAVERELEAELESEKEVSNDIRNN